MTTTIYVIRSFGSVLIVQSTQQIPEPTVLVVASTHDGITKAFARDGIIATFGRSGITAVSTRDGIVSSKTRDGITPARTP